MALGGRLGARMDLDAVLQSGALRPEQLLFAESQSRIVLEVPPDRLADLKANLHLAPHAVIGEVTAGELVEFTAAGRSVCALRLGAAERAWKRPLDLDGPLLSQEAR